MTTTATDLVAFREGRLEIIEHAEVAIVTKEARVVEEVSMRREQHERTEIVHDEVRATKVAVEPIDPGPSRAPPTRPSDRR